MNGVINATIDPLSIKQYKVDNLKLMLNKLISLVFLLLFLNINIAYSEGNFLLPLKKPSIFKKSEEQIKDSVRNDLPAPKPSIQKKEPESTKKVEKKESISEIKIKKETTKK